MPLPADAFDIVHARTLRFFPELVTELGGDPEALLLQAGIGLSALSAPEPRITYRQMVEVLEHTAERLDCPDFGLRLAQRQSGGGTFGPLGQVMQNSRSFGEALAYVAEHSYAHSPAARIWLKEFPAEQAMFVGHEVLLDRLPNRSQTVEHLLLSGHLAAGELTDGRARARRVHFRHEARLPAHAYRRYFDCEVRFGQNEDGIVFLERDLAAPIMTADAQAYAAAIAYVETELATYRAPLHAQTRGIVLQFLGIEACSNAHVATALNLHPRTLHRRLGAEGTSFHRIKDEVRRDLALYYLQQTELDFGRISEKLGFSEQSVLTRRCHLWFATSPSKVRSHERYLTPDA